ncbi:XdhC family protein [soil metagenome]
MKEIKDIIRAFELAQIQGKRTALAMVVHVAGASYRRPGARMLVTDEGEITGAISGGCLEGDALRKSLLVIAQQKPMVVTYDTMDEDDAKFGVGIGCNGVIQVLFEPIDPLKANNPIELLKKIAAKRQDAVLITLFSLQNKKAAQTGTCLLLLENGVLEQTNDAILQHDFFVAAAQIALEKESSTFKNYLFGNENITAFIEYIKPPVSLVVIGAGNDVLPLVEMAAILGWETTVADGRPGYAKQERFVSGCQVLVSKPENVLNKISIDKQTVFVLMTHNYNYDLAMLRALIKKDIVYIGSLGPKKKLDRMLEELKQEGNEISAKQLSAIYGPVGLNIGAENSEEIALSIIAEIKAVLARKNGQSLRDNNEVIHSRSLTNIEQVSLTSGPLTDKH